MTKFEEPLEACPRCKSNQYAKRKLVLIDRGDPAHDQVNWRVSCPCEGDLSVGDLKAEFVVAGSATQFIQGLYCERCGIGYVPEIWPNRLHLATNRRLRAGGAYTQMGRWAQR